MAFDDLYQEILLDHYRNPRNAAVLDHISDENLHENPTCGDSIKLDVKISSDGKIEKLFFDGKGCAISVASASMMTELIKGKDVKSAMKTIQQFIEVMRGSQERDVLEEWGELAALGGVIKFPLRVKCATLAWHALEQCVEK